MMKELNLVFSQKKFLGMAIGIFGSMLLGLLVLSEYVFVKPYFVAHIPAGDEVGLALIVAISGLSATVIPMNVYRMINFRTTKTKVGGSVFGSFIGVVAGACSCGPLGFAILSTFGSIGGVATSFLTTYQDPLRVLSVGILVVTYFATIKSIKTECSILN